MKHKKKLIKELKHQVNFWRNNNQGNYDRWKEVNYKCIELQKEVDDLNKESNTIASLQNIIYRKKIVIKELLQEIEKHISPEEYKKFKKEYGREIDNHIFYAN